MYINIKVHCSHLPVISTPGRGVGLGVTGAGVYGRGVYGLGVYGLGVYGRGVYGAAVAGRGVTGAAVGRGRTVTLSRLGYTHCWRHSCPDMKALLFPPHPEYLNGRQSLIVSS